MKYILRTLCAAMILGTGGYAGGDVKKVTMAVEPYINIEETTQNHNFYVGAGLGVDRVNSFIYEAEIVSSSMLRVGYDFMKYLGVEARGSYGVTRGDNLEHTYSYGLYLKPQYDINEKWKLYALAGYGQTQISLDEAKAKATNVNKNTTQNSARFGIGVEYTLSNRWSLFVDAMRLIDKSTIKPEGEYAAKVDSFAFGVVFRF